ncbi:MAG: hypothetical protein PHP73_03845 [Candidatus Omnitrophica bacterium]|nr:hypothetical protein [Candidatus Omnitrophota bacterium]
MMVLSFYSLETFSQGQVINSERRAKVQNQLVYVLEHMSKYVQQANGNKDYPAIVITTGSDFKVRVDFRSPQDPSDYNSAWVRYYLDNVNINTLKTECAPIGAGTCGPFPITPETLTDKIITFNATQDADPLKSNIIEIDLVGRYDTSSPDTLANPQVEMKTKIICNNCSTN